MTFGQCQTMAVYILGTNLTMGSETALNNEIL